MNALSQDVREIKDIELPIGFDSRLEPGHFYRNTWGLEYKCEAVSGADAQMVLLPTRQQHGEVLSARFVMDTSFGEQYEMITDPDVTERLERAYTEFLTYPKNQPPAPRDVIVLREEGSVLMRPAAERVDVSGT